MKTFDTKYVEVRQYPDIPEDENPVDAAIRGKTDVKLVRRIINMDRIESILETDEGLSQIVTFGGEYFVIDTEYEDMVQFILIYETEGKQLMDLIKRT